MRRRTLVLSAGSAILGGCSNLRGSNSPSADAHAGHGELPIAPSSPQPYARLQGGVPHHLTPEQESQRKTDSPAPPGPAGKWQSRAAMPLPRSEMAWATATAGRMHVVGGYGEGAVNRAYHHIYDPRLDQWLQGAPLPRGANHVAVASDEKFVYALGGFIEQNRLSDANAYAYEIAADRWRTIAPLRRPRGAAAAVMLDGQLHLIGGASEPASERASVSWHEVYDPRTDSWSQRKALPGARDHVGCVAHAGQIHVIGGRFNTFEYNTDLHHVYLPARDTWELRAPVPTARSGHGLVVYRGRFYAMGGEGGYLVGGVPRQATVFGQMESYDPAADTWQRHAPMLTPRHAVGAAAIGDWIYVAGGGAVLGGSVQSAVHEAFTLG
ncbi:kelch repeat-containing protein [Variovorax sp. J22R133]|uniref:Kelch repeat-containing protein n=1 Tax=Variovorax brevis TaxID=3053503 RepID=UPI0025750450|nr:kelch repeat-containing protein [Variovorax sp. J22R133]MDM0111308.1 kelch repeat-containing protein [Variovorax sp. J22R133]